MTSKTLPSRSIIAFDPAIHHYLKVESTRRNIALKDFTEYLVGLGLKEMNLKSVEEIKQSYTE